MLLSRSPGHHDKGFGAVLSHAYGEMLHGGIPDHVALAVGVRFEGLNTLVG
jgi:hypothetical protein